MAKILTKREPTGAGDEPTALEFGELAVNTVDGKLWVGDSTQTPVLLATKGGSLIDVNETAHGFQVLDCVYYDGVNWQKAQANAEDTVALGVVVSVADVDNFAYAFSGRFEIPGNALLDDEWYYLSDTVAGALTATEPAGISQPLVYSETGDFVSIYPYRPAVSPTGALALPPGTGDGNTLRWEADTQQWEQQNNLVVDDAGNVGIGTATPDQKLDVEGTLRVSRDGGIASYAEIENVGVMNIRAINGQSTTYSQMAFVQQNNTFVDREAMRIDASGHVGINTATPDFNLVVAASSDFEPGLVVQSTGGASSWARMDVRNVNADGTGIWYQQASGSMVLRNDSTDSSIAFQNSGGTERARIDASGNLLVGKTDASVGFNSGIQINGNGRLNITNNNGGASITVQAFYNNSASAAGTILSTQTTTTYNTSSDERLKENIQDANSVGADINAVQVRQFDWKATGEHQNYGFIAQELVSIYPEAVSHDKQEDTWGVDPSKLVPMLVKAIQELTARLEVLEGAQS